MLVLSRQLEESIMIGDNIMIKVVDIRGDKVRLGIVAPNEIPVHREEVYEAIKRKQAEQEETSQAGASQLARGVGAVPTPTVQSQPRHTLPLRPPSQVQPSETPTKTRPKVS